jgi:hypothetical protein
MTDEPRKAKSSYDPSQRAYFREYRRQRRMIARDEAALAEWYKTPKARIMKRSRCAKREDLPLPVLAMALEVLEDGRAYTVRVAWQRIKHFSISYEVLQSTMLQRGYRKGLLDRAEHPEFRAAQAAGRPVPPQYVYWINDDGRAALVRAREKYGQQTAAQAGAPPGSRSVRLYGRGWKAATRRRSC